jgi:hypothetical protein
METFIKNKVTSGEIRNGTIYPILVVIILGIGAYFMGLLTIFAKFINNHFIHNN